MAEYRVIWEADIEADDMEAAGLEAYEMQRDPAAIPPIFTVVNVQTGEQRDVDVETLFEDLK